jgi:hypothetical protein
VQYARLHHLSEYRDSLRSNLSWDQISIGLCDAGGKVGRGWFKGVSGSNAAAPKGFYCHDI